MVSTFHHNGHDDLLVDILRGRERIVSYPATSQFNGRGISACGLAAMNFATVLFELIHNHGQDGLPVINLFRAITSKEIIEDIISICSEWSSDLHLDVEDIQHVPPFSKSLNHVSTRHGSPNAACFTRILQDMQALRSSAVVIITRPPETIACAKIMGLGADVFAIFDSHPRPSYPSGAGLILSTSIDQAVARLGNILPAVDECFVSGGGLQWQAQLLNNLAGRIFVSNGPPGDLRDVRQSAIESSLAVLRLQAEMADLKQENARLTSENEALEGHVEYLEDALSVEKTNVTSLQTSSKVMQSVQPISARFTSAIVGPSWLARLFHGQKSCPQSQCKHTASMPSMLNDVHSVNRWETDEALALRLERLELQQSIEDTQLEEALAASLSLIAPTSHTTSTSHIASTSTASTSTASTLHKFSCAICMEEEPMDNSVDLDCKHPICRDCVRGHISSKIEEHRFPVLCPVCMTEQNDRPAVISGLVVELIGVDEQQYAIWEEMELSQYSVLIHCRQCGRSVSVDKVEHEESELLICPLPDCNYVWCKACQLPISADDPPHSCDGTTELDNLMKQQGWKYCPNCKTPIERSGGCRHMNCTAPSCNTHFCYACGESIIRSALQNEIQGAVTAHYNGTCRMFDDVGDE